MQKYSIWVNLPPKECSPNHFGHWANKAKKKKSYREYCAASFLYSGIPKNINSKVYLTLDFYLNRIPENAEDAKAVLYLTVARHDLYFPKDTDNAIASIKACQDALVDARIICNDSRKYITIKEVNILASLKEHLGKTGINVTLEWEEV